MLCKKYFSQFLVSFFLLLTNTIFAHNPDFSSIIISKTKNGKIVMQINSSLTAFQQEVNYINGVGAYETPEEFKNLVLETFKSKFSFILNDSTQVQLKNTKIFLGHETKIVTELTGFPKAIKNIYIKSQLFKDLYNNQSVVMFSIDKFPKNRFTLDNDNNQELNLILKNRKWIINYDNNTFKSFSYLPFVITFFMGILLFFISKKQDMFNS